MLVAKSCRACPSHHILRTLSCTSCTSNLFSCEFWIWSFPLFDLSGPQCPLFVVLRALQRNIVFALLFAFFIFIDRLCPLLFDLHEMCDERCIL